MKLRNIIVSLLAMTALAAGCDKNDIESSYDSFQVSKNFVALPTDGSEVTFEVNSTESWSIYDRLFPEAKNWAGFKVEPLSGNPGKTTVKISSSATTSNRQMELCFLIGDKAVIDQLGEELDAVVAEFDAQKKLALDEADEAAVKKVWDAKKKAAEQLLNSALVNAKRQYVTVKQSAGEAKVVYSSCAEIAAGTSGKVYYAKGSVTKIVNTQYGNWTLKDASGEMYVYGTLDAAGQDKNFASLGLTEGDFVEISGPYLPYEGSPQLKNVTVLKIEKGILKLGEAESVVAKDAKTIDIPLTILEGTEWSVAKIYTTKKEDGKDVEIEAPWARVGTSYVEGDKTYQTINLDDYLQSATPRFAYVRFAARKVESVKKKDIKEPEEGEQPSVVSDKGKLVFEGKLAIGTEIFKDGESKTPAEDDTYILEDGATLKVKDGKVAEIKEVKVAELTYIIKQIGNVPEIKTVAAATDGESNAWVRIKGVVIGMTKYGVVVADETGAIYCDDIATAAVGETVEVSGNVSVSKGYFMLDNCHYEKVPVKSEAVYPTPTSVTEEMIAEVAGRTSGALLQYVKLTGKALAVLGKDDEPTSIKFSVGDYWLVAHNVHSSVYFKNAIDKDVEIYGYAYQLNNSDLRIIVTDLKWPENVEGTEGE